jgi:hypothetical protein
MRVTCDRCLRRYDVPDAALKGRKLRARCKCGARILIQSLDGSSPESAPESKGRPTRWFVDITSWEPITMDLRQLVRAFAAGRIDADTLIWCKGMPDWRRLRDVDELAERLLGMNPGGATRPSRHLPEAASEPPPRLEAAPTRSRTPRASYFVPSAGDTIPLQRPQESASEVPVGSEVAAGSPAASDELEGTSATLSPGADGAEHSDFSPGLESVPPAAPEVSTLEATPESSLSEQASSSASNGHGAPEAGAYASAAEPPITGRDLNAAIVEAAFFAAPDSVRSVDASGVQAPDSARSGSPSKPLTSQATPSQPAPSQPAPSQPAPSQPAAAVRLATSTARESQSAALGAKSARHRSSSRSRRRSSSEETPAQKPSSLSVPPRSARAHRGRRLLAVVGTLAVIWIVARATMEESTKPVSASRPSTQGSVPEPRLQEPQGAARGAALPPVEADKRPESPATDATSRERDGAAGVETQTLQAQVRGALKPTPPSKVAEISVATPAATAPAVERARPAAVAPVTAPKRVPTPSPAPPKPNANIVASGNAAPAPAAPPQPAAKPGPFDMERAEEQMTLAAQVAASCGPTGPQRGAGQVKVLVEPWGRVVRVTHLEQTFVGTPVGICVMQAYQQLHVPPFEGGTRSLIGSFEVK